MEHMLEKIKNEEKIDFEKLIENNNLSDDEFYNCLDFIYKENIPEVRTSLDISDIFEVENQQDFLNEKKMIMDYLNEIKQSKDNSLTNDAIKIATMETLFYSKYLFPFLDMLQEATIGAIKGLSYVNENHEDKEKFDFFIKHFAVKYILEYQKNFLKEMKISKLSFIVYLKVKMDENEGFTKEEISERMGLDMDYIEKLKTLFDETETEKALQNEKLMNEAEKITQTYILGNIPKKLNYIEEQVLSMYYSLEGKKHTKKEIAEKIKISEHNVDIMKDRALNKLSIEFIHDTYFDELSEEALS